MKNLRGFAFFTASGKKNGISAARRYAKTTHGKQIGERSELRGAPK
jgi:hypothetical protein